MPLANPFYKKNLLQNTNITRQVSKTTNQRFLPFALICIGFVFFVFINFPSFRRSSLCRHERTFRNKPTNWKHFKCCHAFLYSDLIGWSAKYHRKKKPLKNLPKNCTCVHRIPNIKGMSINHVSTKGENRKSHMNFFILMWSAWLCFYCSSHNSQ